MSTITQNNRQPSADKPAPPVTLEQKRAQFAWGCAQSGVGAADEKYRNLAKAAPAMIMNNGLMQTLAFLNSKNERHHQELARHLRCWIMKRAGGNGQDPGFQLMMEGLLRAEPANYRQATDEALLILRWVRQFAAAL